MKIFIDSADLLEIKEAYSYGIMDGVTTNPSLMKKALTNNKFRGVSVEKYIKEILKTAGKSPVSLEVTTTDFYEMVKEGKNLFKKFNKFGNVYIKIPVDPCLDKECKNDMDGIRAIRELTASKVPVNCTLIFTPEQALLASKAGAKIVSPFLGRENDFIREKAHIKFSKEDYFPQAGIKRGNKKVSDSGIVSGVDLVEEIVNLFKKHKIKTEVLASSIRNPREFREVAEVGADIATIPFKMIKDLVKHPKTLEGINKFTNDASKEYKKLGEK